MWEKGTFFPDGKDARWTIGLLASALAVLLASLHCHHSKQKYVLPGTLICLYSSIARYWIIPF